MLSSLRKRGRNGAEASGRSLDEAPSCSIVIAFFLPLAIGSCTTMNNLNSVQGSDMPRIIFESVDGKTETVCEAPVGSSRAGSCTQKPC